MVSPVIIIISSHADTGCFFMVEEWIIVLTILDDPMDSVLVQLDPNSSSSSSNSLSFIFVIQLVINFNLFFTLR